MISRFSVLAVLAGGYLDGCEEGEVPDREIIVLLDNIWPSPKEAVSAASSMDSLGSVCCGFRIL